MTSLIQLSFIIIVIAAILTMIGFAMYLFFCLVVTMFVNRRRKKNAPVRKMKVLGEECVEIFESKN